MKDRGDVWRGGNVEFRNDVYFGSSSTVIMPFTQLAGASAAAKVRGGGNGQAALGVCVCVFVAVYLSSPRVQQGVTPFLPCVLSWHPSCRPSRRARGLPAVGN